VTTVSPDARRIWRGVRLPLAILALIFGAVLVAVLARGDQTFGVLEPASYEPSGSRALAQLLKGQGVDIKTVRTFGDTRAVATGATLLVTSPELVKPERLAELRGQAKDVVLVAPSTLDGVVPGVSVDGNPVVEVRPPDCTVSAVVAAGDARLGGTAYRSTLPGVRSCYQDNGSGTLLQVPQADGGTVTLLGAADPLTNAHVGENGNAALSMRLLGKNPRLVWYLPSTTDPALDTVKLSFYDLIPDGWRFGVIQLAIAAVVIALWRTRRLGPVVAEPLPIVVRAAETAEGRARLYRKAGSTGYAGDILREATRARLRPLLGLPVDAEPVAVVESTARRSGWNEARVGALLYGPPATDDPALVRLASDLDDLEQAVADLSGGIRPGDAAPPQHRPPQNRE
jgi:hypothetical protein